jgi:uncharacterized surface protein with fasciclin (FAS1) repeats
MKYSFLFLIIVVIAFSCENKPEASNTDTQTKEDQKSDSASDIIGKLEADGNFKQLLAALETTGLKDKLRGKDTFTLFAPIDDAFDAAREGVKYKGERLLNGKPRYIHALPTDRDSLLQSIKNHLVNGKLTSDDMVKRREGNTLNEMTISFDIEGDIKKMRDRPSNAVRNPNEFFMVNLGQIAQHNQKEYDANLTKVDIIASNGIIHVIDAVLLHPIEDKKSNSPQPKNR